MNKSNFTHALLIGLLFFIFKFIEMRYFIKENQPAKYLVKDSIYVCLAVFVGLYTMKYVSTTKLSNPLSMPKVFTNAPTF